MNQQVTRIDDASQKLYVLPSEKDTLCVIEKVFVQIDAIKDRLLMNLFDSEFNFSTVK